MLFQKEEKKRGLKFRAWDKKHGKMLSWLTVLRESSSQLAILSLFEGRTMPLMLFTGVYDINGNEIYEGDIVKYLTKQYWGGYACDVVQKIGAVELVKGQFTHVGHDCEVVGNIYENPDLRKVC